MNVSTYICFRLSVAIADPKFLLSICLFVVELLYFKFKFFVVVVIFMFVFVFVLKVLLFVCLTVYFAVGYFASGRRFFLPDTCIFFVYFFFVSRYQNLLVIVAVPYSS